MISFDEASGYYEGKRHWTEEHTQKINSKQKKIYNKNKKLNSDLKRKISQKSTKPTKSDTQNNFFFY